ncbi:632_t:CDS:2 [Funneliformis geosporum]|uniref:19050_t:CDS:1 n=1 Tax=Funneliformis geosporum TaxID=1117311 RepID=A0A9W4SNJ0_9GLOM|nr:632_t:CDS:2 [Funneliformis geosporum]CAI2174756.1 19050_t:CDS:2 [Funneliformis geosporum]
MNNERTPSKSNGKISSLLNDDEHHPATNGQNKEITTTNSNGKASPRIKKEINIFKSPKDVTPKSNITSNVNSKNTKKTTSKTATAPKVKPDKNPRKRPLSPSDSEGGREASQEPEKCHHPKHDEYTQDILPPVNKRAKLDKPPKLVGMPKRLEGVLNIDRGTKMCSRCINQTDRDPQYTSHKKYVSRKSVYKKNERARLKIDMNGATE